MIAELALNLKKLSKKEKEGIYAEDANWRLALKSFGSKPKMGVTLVVKCTQCGGLTLAAKEQKTKTCPYCGTQINLQKAPRMAAADTALEASEILRKLKSIKKQNARPSERV
jgi:hypothetical protein